MGLEKENPGTETGYMSDSSLNCKKELKTKVERPDDRTNVKRKTKSERDKKRSSRASIIEDYSESEESSKDADQTHGRYRKRAGSKRPEYDGNNDEKQHNRKSVASKLAAPFRRISRAGYNVERQSKIYDEEMIAIMNNKDIYFGTWNIKERAVLDQILQNLDLKLDKKSAKKLKEKDKMQRKNKSYKGSCKEDEIIISSSNYPFDCYSKDNEKSKNNKSGIISGLKKRFGRQDTTSDRCTSVNENIEASKKKKGLFKRLISNNKTKEDEPPRRRAYSTNDSGNILKLQDSNCQHTGTKKSVSTASLKGMLSRTKSADDLDGAFDFYANKSQIFQRTPSITKLSKKNRTTSIEKLTSDKRSSSQKSLTHIYEPIDPTKEKVNTKLSDMIYAEPQITKLKTASQRSISLSSQSSLVTADTLKNDDEDYCGYQSDQPLRRINSEKNAKVEKHESSRMSTCPIPRKKYYPLSYKQLQQRNSNAHGYKHPINSISINSSISTLSNDNSDAFSDLDSPNRLLSHSPFSAHVSKKPVIRSFSKNSTASTFSSNYGYLSESSNFDEEEQFNETEKIQAKSLQNHNDYFQKGFSRSSVRSNNFSANGHVSLV